MCAADADEVRSIAARALIDGIASPPAGIALHFAAGEPVHPRALVALDDAAPESIREAASAALVALGYPATEIAFAAIGAEVGPESLRLAVETLDPEVIVTLSDAAHRVIVAALAAGEREADGVTSQAGRRIVAIGEFAAALEDESAKRAAWERFKLAGVRGPAY